jgi:hypothetical protein
VRRKRRTSVWLRRAVKPASTWVNWRVTRTPRRRSACASALAAAWLVAATMNGRTSGLDGADMPGDATTHAMQSAVAMAADAGIVGRIAMNSP